ncbi:TPA: MyfA/PsaA family fimbrial adhesin [Yersinia enterocolitica]
MKKFVKKPLAIAVLMLTCGGVVNIAHAATLNSQDVSASKEVKQGGAVKIEFTPSSDEIISGEQPNDVTAFILKVSDSAEHGGWRLKPTGSSKGGYMYDSSGNKVELHGKYWRWIDIDNNWYKNDSKNGVVEEDLYIAKGQVVKPGTYTFTGTVEEYT